MSTLKVNTISNNGTETDTPQGFTIAGNSIVQGYTESASEPSAEPNEGDIWWDTTNSVIKRYINGIWRTITTGASSSDVWGGTRGFTFAGTTNGNSATRNNSIHYFDTTSAGNAVDFGDLTQQVRSHACAGSSTRQLRFGGYVASADAAPGSTYRSNVIDYITCATTGNAVDFGDTLSGVGLAAAASDGTYAIQVGGNRTSTSGISNQMEYVTIATPGNSTDFGDLGAVMQYNTCTNDRTRGISAAGYNKVNTIEYFTMSTPSNAQDFGDLLGEFHHANVGIVSNDTRGLIMGGMEGANNDLRNHIEYITIQTTGNATDFGDLTEAKAYHSGCSNESGDKGFSIGGSLSSGQSNVIEVVTISTTGNATDFGDGLNTYMQGAGASGNAS